MANMAFSVVVSCTICDLHCIFQDSNCGQLATSVMTQTLIDRLYMNSYQSLH